MKIKNRKQLIYKLGVLSIWTMLVAILLGWNLYNNQQTAIESARIKARALWKKDIIYREWNGGHSGVYAPVTKSTQPNLYLDVPERDIQTPSGKKLTLINPACMTRQIYEIARKEYGIEGHLTSLKLIRPQNKADKWETEALKSFEEGQKEHSIVIEEKNKRYLRLMKPLITQQTCLQCHQSQGYKIGDVRGGISLKVPMKEFLAMSYKNSVINILAYWMIWLPGIGAIFWVANIIELNFKKMQIHQKQLESIYQSMEKSITGFFIVNSDYTVRHMNQIMKEWFGEQTGKLCYKAIAGLSSPCPYCKIKKVINFKECVYYEPTTSDGRTFEISATPLINEDGSVSKLEVIKEITDRKKIEQERLKLRKLESLGVLAGGIAHDFNNTLTGLFGNLELAKLKIHRDHPAYTFIKTSGQALEQTINLTKQLLTFSKGGDPILESVNLKSVIQNTVDFNLTGSNAKAHFNLPDNLWDTKADKGQISQVIANLTINAKQAMPNGGSINIEAENIKDIKEVSVWHLSGDFVKFSIRDEGTGISAKHLERIFDPYFTTKQTGSGLGLATTHSIVTKHNGYISVDSTPDVGTTFTIFLPAEKSFHKSTTATRPDIPEKSTSTLGHILVMDDEKMIRDISAAMLKQFGYTVDSAVDGKMAVEKYISAYKSGNSFDIVIMDLTIPGGMGGKEAVDKLLAINSEAKVVVSSGYSTDPIMAHYNAYGFKGRLVKPFQMEDLKNELSRVMEIG